MMSQRKTPRVSYSLEFHLEKPPQKLWIEIWEVFHWDIIDSP